MDQRLAERRAKAREQAAACTIFLWLCHCRLHIRLVCQTSRCQQCEAAFARLRYEQDCCRRAALAEEQCRQAAAARAKAAIDEATEQLRRVEDALLSAWAIALAVADDKHHRHEVAAHDTALAAKVLVDKRGGQELAVRAVCRAGLGHRAFSTPPPHIVCGCGSVYSGGEPSAGCAVVSTIAYHRQPTPNGMPMCPTLPSHWTSQPSSRAQSY